MPHSSEQLSETTYQPYRFLTSNRHKKPQYALLILNQPISSIKLLKRLWNSSQYKICADGGANQLFHLFDNDESVDSCGERASFIPNRIHGDLDSVDRTVRSYYESKGVEVDADPDQYSTDFGKCMRIIRERKRLPSESLQLAGLEEMQSRGSQNENPTLGKLNQNTEESGCALEEVDDILILGTISGRIDQGIGLLHEMLREQTRVAQPPASPFGSLYLVSECSVSFLLLRNSRNFVQLAGPDREERVFTPNVGILPIYGPATISTKGLEWDVEDWETSMGTQVSTSNHVTAEDGVISVIVKGDHAVLFTVERVGDDKLPDVFG